ncbi:MAG: rod shape-determining protein MreC [Alphaproteobacteria bacterium]|nr:rod shape-determining protein MreC [Alphaproteobacteria bacterium]MBQ4130411.1 rod shape-determining protein MreC [Alphaproteobacteria bacterium]
MKQNKISSKIYPLVRAAATAAVLPVLFIYVMIAKPDYTIMNALGHVVVPVAQTVGDVITWPFRVVGRAFSNIAELSSLRAENEELRVRLDAALANKTACEVAIKENQKLNRELDIVISQPRGAIIADVVQDNSAMGHNTYLINRGARDGIESGMVVATTDMQLAGIVIDAATNFSRVRALTDADTNIAVRVVGSDVYGFMTGNGSARPSIGFFSDPEFQPSQGIKLITSNISGVLPAGLMVGELVDETDVKVVGPNKLSRVLILKFDTPHNEYK